MAPWTAWSLLRRTRRSATHGEPRTARQPVVPSPQVPAARSRVVCGDGAPEAGRPVGPRAVQQQRVEQERVTRLHLDVDALDGGAYARRPEEAEVDVFPVGHAVLVELAAMAAGQHGEAPVLPRHRLEGRPRADDLVAGPEAEVQQVLVQRVSAVDA